MTAKQQFTDASCGTPRRPLSAGTLAFCLMSALTFFLLVLCAEEAIMAMREALSLCARTVIPSLFPFMVASELIVRSGVATSVGRFCAPVTQRIFGIGGEGSPALLLGMLCGFPVGAKSAAGLYQMGKISRGELCRLLCIGNQPSSAFVISAVGISLFGSRRFGMLLYGTTLASGLLVGLICHFWMPTDLTLCPNAKKTKRKNALSVLEFTDAITGAAHGMLSVCAFVCFFATLVGCLSAIPAMERAPDWLRTLTFGFFELTGGVSRAAACRQASVATYLAALCIGWSGLSVHFQVMCLCDRCEISFRPYFVAKAAQGILNVLLVAVSIRIWPPSADTLLEIPPNERGITNAWPIWLACFAVAIVIGSVRWWKNHDIGDKK